MLTWPSNSPDPGRVSCVHKYAGIRRQYLRSFVTIGKGQDACCRLADLGGQNARQVRVGVDDEEPLHSRALREPSECGPQGVERESARQTILYACAHEHLDVPPPVFRHSQIPHENPASAPPPYPSSL